MASTILSRRRSSFLSSASMRPAATRACRCSRLSQDSTVSCARPAPRRAWPRAAGNSAASRRPASRQHLLASASAEPVRRPALCVRLGALVLALASELRLGFGQSPARTAASCSASVLEHVGRRLQLPLLVCSASISDGQRLPVELAEVANSSSWLSRPAGARLSRVARSAAAPIALADLAEPRFQCARFASSAAILASLVQPST